ncbi:RNA-directed DNA polymerase from mobile element jockey [Trichonephila clavipes]|nr:RNA-directed DNA polymerase from mobile element jockey [Trichonephila clavipes]
MAARNTQHTGNSWQTKAIITPLNNPIPIQIIDRIKQQMVAFNKHSKLPSRLNDHLKSENILIPEQQGFRPCLSTSHQLLRVVEFNKEGNNRDQYTAAVFLDIQKAFNRVWHTGLFFKLITYKLPPPLGRGSRVVKVSDCVWLWHKFEPSATKDPPCRGAIHFKSVES